LQIQRESVLSNSTLSNLWIFNEASKMNNVIKYGTLKKSCQNYLETRVSNLFSGIISYLDTNDNLDLLILNTDNPNNEWLSNLWLFMFDIEEINYIDYKSFYLNQTMKEKNEFPYY